MIIRKLYSLGLLMLFSIPLFAQKVPYSSQTEDQLLQGPCYIFAAVAAMESKALQSQGKTEGAHSGVDFNEWRYWSDCVLGGSNGTPNASITQLVGLPMQHMKQFGAVQSTGSFDFINKSQLPNYQNPNCGDFGGIASFQCTGGPLGGGTDNLNWCEQFGGYVKNFGDCTDDEGTGYFSFSQPLINGASHFSYSNINIHHVNATNDPNINSQDVIAQLAAGNGVIAVINGYQNATCDGDLYAAQHAIFIYEHTNGRFYFKDSWPGNASNRRSMSTVTFDGHDVAALAYASGSATCNTCPPDDGDETNVACDYDISGPSQIGCSTTTYRLTGGTGTVSNISWQVPSGVTIVSGASSTTLRVRSNNCGSSFSGQISVSYTDINSCTATPKSVTVSGGNVSTVSSIQLNGPASGQISDVCPGSAVQLVAVDNNSGQCPIYEWYVSGATILNGQGTNEINIQTDNVDGAYQYYRVRVKKACGSFTSWRTQTGYLDDCSSDPGGGIGIFPAGFGFAHVLGTDQIFQGHPSIEELDVQIFSLSGQKLEEFRVQRNQSALDLSNLPAGILVARFYDVNQNLVDARKVSIVR